MNPREGLSSPWTYTRIGQHTPDLEFFDSKNFQEVESTQKRREEEAKEKVKKVQKERSRRGALAERSVTPDVGYYSQMFRADGNPKPKKPRPPPQTFYGLRRPLDEHDQRVVAAIPAYEKDHMEYVDKPYSTVYTGLYAYKDRYPLLMQVHSEAEDRDVTVIETETRRKSIVTTNYASATIKLENEAEEIKFAVFPILHRVIESDSDMNSDDEDDIDDVDVQTGSNDFEGDGSSEHDRGSTPKNSQPPLLPRDELDRLTAIAMQDKDEDHESDNESEESEPPPGWLENRNIRMPTGRRPATNRPCAAKPRMLKRRSIDFGSLFYHNEVESMDTIGESEESVSGTNDNEVTKATTISGAVPRGTWAMAAEEKDRYSAESRDLTALIQRAEKGLEQSDYNLHKLEDFLLQVFSDESFVIKGSSEELQ